VKDVADDHVPAFAAAEEEPEHLRLQAPDDLKGRLIPGLSASVKIDTTQATHTAPPSRPA
jgi:hypothetical protein